jgi:tetratricopeptide (TPR) repeat protein
MSKARNQGVFWIYRKLLCADYQGALKRADWLIRWFPGTPAFHFLRGTVLLFAGRLAEADESLRTSIAKSLIRAGHILPGALSNLAGVLLRLGRFPGATAALEAATKLYPRFSGAHNGLAEVLLSQGQEPRRALLLVDNALKLRQSDPRTQNVDRHSLANMWANRAQALALLGQKEEAASAVAAAESVGDPAFIPGMAGTYWRCGVALRLMDQGNAAVEQFRKAAALDPHGLYGKLAGSALAGSPVHEHDVHR